VPSDGQSRLISGAELARQLDVSERTVERWRFDNYGPRPIRLAPRIVRYSREDVEQFIESRR